MAEESKGADKQGQVSVREAAETEEESRRREEEELEKRHEPQRIVIKPGGEVPMKGI